MAQSLEPGAVVGAGVGSEGKIIPPGHLAVGVPARVVRELTEEDVERLMATGLHYVDASRVYRESNESGKRDLTGETCQKAGIESKP